MLDSPPNPRLQRTRSATPPSPLRSKPLGRRRRTLGTALLLSFAGSQMMVPCSRYGPVDSKATVEGALVIVVAKAGAYVRRPEVQRRPDGEGVVRFTVREVLKGGGVPSELQIHGYLDDRDDFNDHPPPYHFVRPGGRAGSCFAGNYRRGATYLLLLQN